MREITDDMSAADKKVLQDVAEEGLHILHVLAVDERPGFSFTVGLWHHFDQPEVIAFGLPQDVAVELFNTVADEADAGKRFRALETHSGLLVGYPVRFVDVPKDEFAGYLGVATWAYEGECFECVQLVWPDKSRRWPWETGVHPDFRSAQPILGRHGPLT